ncbi:MAG: response regulator [Chitinophagales bacterium]
MTDKLDKIVLIDDNEGDAILLGVALDRISENVDHNTFQSGEEALTQFKKWVDTDRLELPNLIILDLNMPGMDGIAVLKALKQCECLSKVPVVVMTTSSLKHDIERSYFAGANSVIVKPIDFEKYVAAIDILVQYWFKTVKTALCE